MTYFSNSEADGLFNSTKVKTLANLTGFEGIVKKRNSDASSAILVDSANLADVGCRRTYHSSTSAATNCYSSRNYNRN